MDQAVQDDFALDVQITVARHPVGKLTCTTGDGCGNTCAGTASACNSYVGDPV
jgi:FxLD family lantipeptide